MAPADVQPKEDHDNGKKGGKGGKGSISGNEKKQSGNGGSSKGCIHCDGPHSLLECPTFRDLTVEDRKKVAMKKGACFFCSEHGHTTAKCPHKETLKKCYQCSGGHHALFCDRPSEGTPKGPPKTGSS